MATLTVVATSSCSHSSVWDRVPETRPAVCHPDHEPRGGKIEPWLTTSPTIRGGVELPREFVAETPFLEAYERLERDSFVVLTDVEAASFANSHWHCPSPRRTILARGVLFERGTGGFGVELYPGGVLRVFHSSLGGSIPPLTQQPVLVCATAPPTEVCVTADIAE